VVTGFLVRWPMPLALAQQQPQQAQAPREGIVDDWSHRHVIFSNPGTREDAIKNGRWAEWQRIVSSPRYRIQQMKQGLSMAGQDATLTPGVPQARELGRTDSNLGNGNSNFGMQRFRKEPLHADWNVPLAPVGLNGGHLEGKYPAKYSLDPSAAPDCDKDFVVFPTDLANADFPGLDQAQLVGINNLYSSCRSAATVLFAYSFLGPVAVQTSPVLSLDGNKVAVVATNFGAGSFFSVITLDKTGNGGCATGTSPCNGTSFYHPQFPCNFDGDVICRSNGAAVRSISLTPEDNRFSSPFVDYADDTAYVADDVGVLYKVSGVFNGNLAVDWKSDLGTAPIYAPLFDSGPSRSVFAVSRSGTLFCVTEDGHACTPNGSIQVGTGTTSDTAVLDAPILDAATQTRRIEYLLYKHTGRYGGPGLAG
jgi:hypothetical protein